MSKKTIRCVSYDGLVWGNRVRWSDTGIEYHDRRKRVQASPTLLTSEELWRDLALTASRYFTAARNKKEYAEEILVQYREIESLQQRLFQSGIVVEDPDNGLTDIVTTANWIDKGEAEKMLACFLRSRGFKGPFRFQWNKPDFFVQPI